MLRTFDSLRRHCLAKRKSPKVADEAMFHDPDRAEISIYGRQSTRTRPIKAGFSVISTIVRVPFSVLSCFCYHHGNNRVLDGMWVSSDIVRNSEIDHLMVRDSMRYAILM
ncbi:hypothetical protein RND81_09G188200 [Saponaria officinalis]|uniref:Uncharacterized protein n=1 Tax=Saponaria officinalis TaxID=3572 RepID=A0AAW1IMQ3_SAPOF